jgi:hypothetical protein
MAAKRDLGFWCLLACATTVLAPAHADDERFSLGGLVDAELWKTDEDSTLLAHNEGDPATAAKLQLWAAGKLTQRLQAVVLGELEGGSADEHSGVESEIELAFLRHSFGGRQHLQIEAGRIQGPLGNFSGRHLSSANPLIGQPASYGVSYPLGAQVAGSVSLLDFRVAVLDEPLVYEGYVPEPDSALRPAAALGVTPVFGLRLGGYFTSGPYLSSSLEEYLPHEQDWKDFEQRIAGFDLRFGRGHLELNADWSTSRHEVPTRPDTIDAQAWFVEGRYALTPRWFTAARIGSTELMYVAPGAGEYADWISAEFRVDDAEVGAGYRFGPDTILKLSWRVDDWAADDPVVLSYYPDGHALALQLSQTFDVRGWFEAPR